MSVCDYLFTMHGGLVLNFHAEFQNYKPFWNLPTIQIIATLTHGVRHWTIFFATKWRTTRVQFEGVGSQSSNPPWKHCFKKIFGFLYQKFQRKFKLISIQLYHFQHCVVSRMFIERYLSCFPGKFGFEIWNIRILLLNSVFNLTTFASFLQMGSILQHIHSLQLLKVISKLLLFANFIFVWHLFEYRYRNT